MFAGALNNDFSSSPPPPSIRRLTSVFWGFFSGGARNVHTDVILELQSQGIEQHIINYYDSMDRGAEGVQHKESNLNYQRLNASGVTIDSLGLTHHNSLDLNKKIEHFSGEENPSDPLETIVRDLAYKLLLDKSDAIVSLKEQPINLLILANRYLVDVMGKAPKPILVTLHRVDPGLQDQQTFAMLDEIERDPYTQKFIAGYIACSESAMIAYRQALGLEVGSSRITFVPNGIDLSVFRPHSLEDINAFVAQEFLDAVIPPSIANPIVTIGARNSPEKDISLFLEAAYLLLHTNPEAHAVMCGSGMDREGLRELMQRAAEAVCLPEPVKDALDNRLHTMGRVSSAEMALLFSMSAVAALTTSPLIGEADGLVLKEGMSCEAVPVSTCCGEPARTLDVGTPDQPIVEEIREGFVIGGRGILTSQNPADIAAAWAYAISHKAAFTDNIREYRPLLSREIMGHGYKEAITALITEYYNRATVQWSNTQEQIMLPAILAMPPLLPSSDQQHFLQEIPGIL